MSEELLEAEADWQYILSHIRDLVHDLLAYSGGNWTPIPGESGH